MWKKPRSKDTLPLNLKLIPLKNLLPNKSRLSLPLNQQWLIKINLSFKHMKKRMNLNLQFIIGKKN